MKTTVLVQIAIWLAERASSDSAGEAFAGDLLESFARGRSAWWCLAEALFRVGASVEQRLRALLMPLWYCIAFVCLHPLWHRLYAPSTESFLVRYRDITVWPGSAVLEIASEQRQIGGFCLVLEVVLAVVHLQRWRKVAHRGSVPYRRRTALSKHLLHGCRLDEGCGVRAQPA